MKQARRSWVHLFYGEAVLKSLSRSLQHEWLPAFAVARHLQSGQPEEHNRSNGQAHVMDRHAAMSDITQWHFQELTSRCVWKDIKWAFMMGISLLSAEVLLQTPEKQTWPHYLYAFLKTRRMFLPKVSANVEFADKRDRTACWDCRVQIQLTLKDTSWYFIRLTSDKRKGFAETHVIWWLTLHKLLTKTQSGFRRHQMQIPLRHQHQYPYILFAW